MKIKFGSSPSSVDLPQVDHFCVATVFSTRDEVARRTARKKVVSGRLISRAGI